MTTPHDTIEIMAPAGSYESLMAAIQGAADSVYFGVGKLNMRARSSKNFSLDDLARISKICHAHGKRSYITLNTIIYDDETKEMETIVDAAKAHGISAIIASDMAVIDYAHSQQVEVHMSTQTNITNLRAVRYYAQFADVMVTARELSLEQVGAITRAIKEQNITGPSGELVQIEVFAHGALCMAVSGKCYLSLDNMNSSANRGACLQVCRRGYKVTDLDGEIELAIDNEYIMSPKDLKTIHFMNKMMDAGVRVFKIEGRARGPEYVRRVTECYKEAVVAYCNDEFTEEKIEVWNEKLATVFNRGFWDGYYLGQRLGEWTHRYGSGATKRKVYLGKAIKHFGNIGVTEFLMETQSLKPGEEVLITGPTTGAIFLPPDEIRVD